MSSQVSGALRQGLRARRAETVEKLLDAGLEELRSVGHELLTIRTVAHRAGVSPATAYTYLASKHHLYAELFWRHLAGDDARAPIQGGTARERLQATVRVLTERIAAEPALTAAVTPALLGSDPDVARLRLRIGREIAERFEGALRDPAHPDAPADAAVLDVLVLTFSGILLQAGMGLVGYDRIADRLASAVDVVLREARP